jgi:hypothetical protein
MKFLFGALLYCLAVQTATADSPIMDAAKRGLVGKPESSRMSSARWNREQQAAIEKSEAIMRRALKEPGLLAQYEMMRARYEADDNRVFRLVFGQYLSWFQTWVGDYDGARASFSIPQPAQPDDAPPPKEFHARRADEAILDLAHGHKAVFFNESHSAPVTRTLTVALLARLREQGFDYFAAETLSHDFAAQAYPTARSGFYVNEPICGEMLRAALRLGYHVVAYDVEEGATDTRERAAAQSLYDQTFKRDPAARLVVNAGFSHIQKSGSHVGGPSMAEVFQKISGVEPLSIEQTMMIEHPNSSDNHPYYRTAVAAEQSDAPFVYQDDAGKPWTLKPHQYDVSVFFPPEKHIDGRPDWISIGARKPLLLGGPDCLYRFPCLIEARYAAEGADAVAADRVVLEADTVTRLLVYPGMYRVSSFDREGKLIVARDMGIAN